MSIDLFLQGLLWSSLALLLYTYAGYPLVLAVLSIWGGKRVVRRPITPRVSIVIAAWNEAGSLACRITNCLDQQYPATHLDVVVVSDGSDDNTEAVVRQCDPGRVTLVVLQRRMGKAVALNAGVAVARGKIVVFTDARQRFEPSAVAELVSNFADPRVGAVSGELMLQTNPNRVGLEAVGLYWRSEKWSRRKEGEIASVVGATGSIYASRRELFEPLPSGAILDDVLTPMRVAMQGYRVVFDWRALAFAQTISRQGHQVTLIATSQERRSRTLKYLQDDVTIVETPDLFSGSLRSGWDPWNSLHRIAWAHGQRIDLVHAFELRPTVLAPSLYMKFARRTPFVSDWADWFGKGGSVEERPNPLLRTETGRAHV